MKQPWRGAAPPGNFASLARFQFDPAEDDQPFNDQVVTCFKIVVTITSHAPDLWVADGEDFSPPEVVDDLEGALPPPGLWQP